MKKIRDHFFRMCVLVLAGGIAVLVLLTMPGCGSRETEFLKAAEQEELLEEDASLDQSEEGMPSQAPALTEPEGAPKDRIYVDVCGAVVRPGVYELDADSRVFQALEAAGGILPEAAGEYVNRAGYLMDGQQIYIPTREEAEKNSSFQDPMEQILSGQMAESGNTMADSGGKVNLNTADEAALTTLTGIGASKAQAILAYREEHGRFSAIEEILNVPGIKEGTFVKIKDNIAVE